MRLKSITTLIAIIGLSGILLTAGCHHKSASVEAEAGATLNNVAPSDVKTDGKSNSKGSKTAAGAETASADSNQTETNSIVDPGSAGIDLAEREEIRRSYSLKPAANVIVSGINGRVDVETAETDHAEVLIVRSAKNREDLQFRKINIDHDPTELRIRVEDDRRSIFSAFSSRREARQRVVLKLPRKAMFETNNVNGNVTVGELDGSVEVRNVNGTVNIAQATGSARFHGVNGKIDATVAKLTGEGVGLTAVNGNTTLRFVGEVNAEVEARGQNGKVSSDLPNLEERKYEKQRHGVYNARIGAGGPQIEIHGVNGNVYLTRAEKSNANAKVAAK